MHLLEQGQDFKNLSATLALEKLLKLDRKFTTFDYSDTLRNVLFQVQSPPLMNDYHNGEHLLRLFWIQIANAYFRKLSHNQIDRLIYFQSILNEEPNDALFEESQQFWINFNTVFIKDKAKQICGQGGQLDHKNWISTLFIYYFNFIENKQHKGQKRLDKQLAELIDIRNSLRVSSNNYHQTLQSLETESVNLLTYLPERAHDELTGQLQTLTQNLQFHHANTSRLFYQLEERVSYEQRNLNSFFCFGEIYEQDYVDVDVDRDDGRMESEQEVVNQKLQEIDLQLRYFQYLITCLEKKQIAESISKIEKVEKSRGQTKLTVIFQEAMNRNKTVMSESELINANKTREYSLFGFYNTSLKTPYSFISQNFYGFSDIYRHRLRPGKNRNKNMLGQMKETLIAGEDVCKEMKKFDICHHCKYFYPEIFLTRCKYNSEKLGRPIEPASYGDPYLNQMSKIDISKASRYCMRKRNTCFNYTKIGQQFCCNRKFCKSCLKQSYIDGFDKSGLCPFCQGICYCTRCTRNQMITKLKSLYSLLGGQMNVLEESRKMSIEENSESQMKKKGRPKKITHHLDVPSKTVKHMNTIRVQLQPLRLLSDMVKKREKTKLKVIQYQQNTFISKISVLSQDFNCWPKNHGMTLDSSGQNDSESLSFERNEIGSFKGQRKNKRMA